MGSNKIAQYLQEHISGEIITAADARRHFSNDNSIFSLTPALIVYPRSEQDVRKTARFVWQLAERNRILPITPRGSGTDLSGAAIGSGIILVFPAHLNRVLELDSKSGIVVVEPGLNYGTLQQTLKTHGRFLPPAPSSADYSTIGGAVANNASGELSVKYGATREYVRSVRMVLANGEVLQSGRINKRELGKKLGLNTFEGEIYRSLDALLEDNKDTIDLLERAVTKNNAGYHVQGIKRKDGSFDLTPLLVGSQGTLGIITEITLDTEAHNPETATIAAFFDSPQHLQSAVTEIKKDKELPSSVELIDGHLLSLAVSLNASSLKSIVSAPFPKFMLLIDFDDASRLQKKLLKKTRAILKRYATAIQEPDDAEGQELLWRLRELSHTALTHAVGNAKALPIIEDGVVPLDKLSDFLTGIYEIFERNHVQPAIWGHAGDANLHVQPHLDLSQIGDRQRVLRMMDEYYKLVISLGGSTTGEHGDGRVRGPFLEKMYGPDGYELFVKIKKIFDPQNILNPGVKVGVTFDDLKQQLRQDYSLNHLYNHLPKN